MIIHVTVWDAVLMVAVTSMAGLLVFLRSSGWKAFMLSLPIPFTCATLSLGQGVGVINVSGMRALLLFTYGVRFCYYRLKWPIVPVIALCALGYCLLAAGSDACVPRPAEPGSCPGWRLDCLPGSIGHHNAGQLGAHRAGSRG